MRRQVGQDHRQLGAPDVALARERLGFKFPLTMAAYDLNPAAVHSRLNKDRLSSSRSAILPTNAIFQTTKIRAAMMDFQRPLKRYPFDLNRWDSQEDEDGRVFVH